MKDKRKTEQSDSVKNKAQLERDTRPLSVSKKAAKSLRSSKCSSSDVFTLIHPHSSIVNVCQIHEYYTNSPTTNSRNSMSNRSCPIRRDPRAEIHSPSRSSNLELGAKEFSAKPVPFEIWRPNQPRHPAWTRPDPLQNGSAGDPLSLTPLPSTGRAPGRD